MTGKDELNGDNRSRIDSLTETVEILSENTHDLAVLVGESNIRQTKDSRILRGVAVLMIAKLVTLVLLLVVIVQVVGVIHRIDDVTDPNGGLQRKASANSALLASSISYQTEAQRLVTEVGVGESTGLSPEALAKRKQRLVEVGVILKKISENIDDVRFDRPQRNKIPAPVELPSKT